jgi:hypothetical protein
VGQVRAAAGTGLAQIGQSGLLKTPPRAATDAKVDPAHDRVVAPEEHAITPAERHRGDQRNLRAR